MRRARRGGGQSQSGEPLKRKKRPSLTPHSGYQHRACSRLTDLEQSVPGFPLRPSRTIEARRVVPASRAQPDPAASAPPLPRGRARPLDLPRAPTFAHLRARRQAYRHTAPPPPPALSAEAGDARTRPGPPNIPSERPGRSVSPLDAALTDRRTHDLVRLLRRSLPALGLGPGAP